MDIKANKYRIAYEAFSKFSANASKTKSVDELAQVVKRDLKYFFNFYLLRIVVFSPKSTKNFTFSRNHYEIERYKKNSFPYELDLLESQVPFCEPFKSQIKCPFIEKNNLTNPNLWGWYFEYQRETRLCVSVLADEKKPFTRKDIDLLNLLVDTFSTKYIQLNLHSKLLEKNTALARAIGIIEKKNKHIQEIVDNQQQTIYDRTQQIMEKNDKLLEISKLNAHNVREPLSRILGLIEIAKHFESDDLKDQILAPLNISAQELDETLKSIVEKSAGETDKLIAENEE